MRARIIFSKTGALRYIGHLDLQTLWERAARRAGLPLVYTQAFHPQARIHLAAALPLGFSARAEVMDMRLAEDVPLGELPARLQEALPPGITIHEVLSVDDAEPPLQTRVRSAEYEVTLLEPPERPDLEQRLAGLLASAALPRERRGKEYDLRPLVEELRLLPGAPVRLFMRLSAREAATGRPEEVLAQLGLAARDARIERTRLIFQE